MDRPIRPCYFVTNCTMAEELVRVALRVLACLTVNRQHPSPKDVARLRAAVTEEERGWEVDALAGYIIHREVRQHKVTQAERREPTSPSAAPSTH
jgi:hypothetical protein